MRRGVLVVGVTLCVAAVVSVFAGARQEPPELDRADAREFTRRALADLGFDDVHVARGVSPGEHEPESGGEPVAVWITRATVEEGTDAEGTVELKVRTRSGTAAYVNDLTADRGDYLLDEDQLEQLKDFKYDPPLDARNRRNLLAAVAGVGIVAMVVLIVMRVTDLEIAKEAIA